MIYVCYGVTKSASTYVFQLTYRIALLAGCRPARFGSTRTDIVKADHYVQVVDAPLLDMLSRRHPGQAIILKTHGPLDADVAHRIRERTVLASASIRDPREIALAMLDHGHRTRRWGLPEFSNLRSLADTLPELDDQVALFRTWSALSEVATLRYNDICFDTGRVVERIARQIGVEIAVEDVVAPYASRRWRIGQFNRGEPLRYRAMSQADSAMFLDRYATLYGERGFDTPTAVALAARRGRAERQRESLDRLVAETLRTLFLLPRWTVRGMERLIAPKTTKEGSEPADRP